MTNDENMSDKAVTRSAKLAKSHNVTPMYWSQREDNVGMFA